FRLSPERANGGFPHFRPLSGLSGPDPVADTGGMADAARMSMRSKPLTVAFYIAFALWFTAIRYSSPGFYGWLLAPVVGTVLTLGTIALFFMVVVLAARRGVRAASFPWLNAAVIACAIIGFDLFWRFYLSPFAWDAFKLTSILLDMATPIIAALGLAAVVGELRRPVQVIAG
ncbi:hypothetical protein, partial [Sphingomonas sp. LaA6.9]|uniref:hypothetical protein n=1 Tax=Sphingomonas sp. LaA6.9 TaxID=2919914 RepID=UPI001F4F6B9E